MPFTAGELIMAARDDYGVPVGSNRWPDSRMLRLAKAAANDIAIETDFPEATHGIFTVAGQREYQMIDCVKILRCYLIAGGNVTTPLPGTDIPTLEGDILQIYDQSSGTIPGQAGFSPQFLAEAPQQYPLSNSNQGRVQVPTAMPYFSVSNSAQRGVYYHRGGNLGIDPAPAQGGLILAVDHIPLQPFIQSDETMMIYPQVYLSALKSHMCAEMARSDRSSMMSTYQGLYTSKLPDLRTWLDNLWATKPKRFVPITKRSQIGSFDDWGYGW